MKAAKTQAIALAIVVAEMYAVTRSAQAPRILLIVAQIVELALLIILAIVEKIATQILGLVVLVRHAEIRSAKVEKINLAALMIVAAHAEMHIAIAPITEA